MFGELVKPIDTLVSRSCDGIGGFLKPWQMKRIAKAEIEIAQLKAQSELNSEGVLLDAQKLLVHEAIKKQANLHNIKIEATKYLGANDELTNVPEDFINFFVEKAQNVSDENLQQLWGKVLAGELQSQGSFSKRTLDFISTLSVEEANNIYKLFNGLAIFNGRVELFLTSSSLFEAEGGLSQKKCDHLENLGVFSSLKPLEVFIPNPDKKKKVLIRNIVVTLDKKLSLDAEFSPVRIDANIPKFVVTKTPLTSLGQELVKIAQPKPDRRLIRKITRELGSNNLFVKFRPCRYKRSG